jgi:hypothetical protein
MSSQPIPTPTSGDDPLRYTFVEMLFALAVSQVAIHLADLSGAQGSFREKTPAITHLLLGLVVISASWVGWRQSQSPGMRLKIENLLSLRFFALLVDVALVIVYFILVRSVELQQKNGATVLDTPSARPEALWVAVIFAMYIIWDVMADVLSPGSIPTSHPFTRIMVGARVLLVCCFASATCFWLAFRIYQSSDHGKSIADIAFLDLALLFVVLLFRTLKTLEAPFSKLLRVSNCRAFAARQSIIARDLIFSTILIAGYFACISLTSPVAHEWFEKLVP